MQKKIHFNRIVEEQFVYRLYLLLCFSPYFDYIILFVQVTIFKVSNKFCMKYSFSFAFLCLTLPLELWLSSLMTNIHFLESWEFNKTILAVSMANGLLQETIMLPFHQLITSPLQELKQYVTHFIYMLGHKISNFFSFN
jgi:hypothetical protein